MTKQRSSVHSLIEGGVFDLYLETMTFGDPQNDRALAIGATGIQSMIGPFLVDSFAEALKTVVVSKEEIFSEPQPVDLRYVLAQPWRQDRMESALARRATDPIPSIVVNRISVPAGPDFFEVRDGCHRGFAARNRGDRTIDAVVQVHYKTDPSEFVIVGTKLVPRSVARNLTDGLDVDAGIQLGPDMIAILTALGCSGRSSPLMSWSFDVR